MKGEPRLQALPPNCLAAAPGTHPAFHAEAGFEMKNEPESESRRPQPTLASHHDRTTARVSVQAREYLRSRRVQ